MEEGYSIEQWPPLWHVSIIQLFLANASICSLQPCLHTLWRLIGELDASLRKIFIELFKVNTCLVTDLEQGDRKLGMDLSGDPHPT